MATQLILVQPFLVRVQASQRRNPRQTRGFFCIWPLFVGIDACGKSCLSGCVTDLSLGCSLPRDYGHAALGDSRGVVPDERSPVACDRFVSRGGSLARGRGHTVSRNSCGVVPAERSSVTCDRLGSLVTSSVRGFRQAGCGLSRWGGVMGLRVVGRDRRDRRGSGWSAGRQW